MLRSIRRLIPWNYRYRRYVPPHHRRLIGTHRLPKPNWFVGAAEQPSVPRDPELVNEIEDVKRRLRNYRSGEQSPAPAEAPPSRATVST